jgi:NitT/TauT family transport system permease protein
MKRFWDNNFKNVLVPGFALVIIIVIWEVSVKVFSIDQMILPRPWQVLVALWQNLPRLAWHGGITLLESVLGFFLGSIAAIILAIIFQYSKTVEKAIYPYAIALKAVPLVALAPLVVVWCGSGLMSKLVLAAIISFFPVLVNTARGLVSVESEALDLMNTLSASKWQILVKVRFPTALPSMFDGMKISSTFAVVGAVVAEFVGSGKGIGYIVKTSSYYLDTDICFAAIIMMGLISLLFFGTVCLIERKVIFWIDFETGAKKTSIS